MVEDPSSACADEQGHTAVYLRALTSVDQGRQSAWVFADDISSGNRVECEVFVDAIHRLELLTNTRVVNVGDAEAIDIQAYDGMGNVFSSVQG